MSEVTFGPMTNEGEGQKSLDFFVDGKIAGYIEADMEDTSRSRARTFRVTGYTVVFFHLDNEDFEIDVGTTPREALAEAKRYVSERYAKRVSGNPPYDPAELRIGTDVEMEHTDDRREAAKIAKEHLDEHPDYYSRLKSVGLANPGFQYRLPEERLSARSNPAKNFSDAFGIPYEAHLAPVWPTKRKKNEPKIYSAESLVAYLAGLSDIPQEEFLVALLDSRGALIGIVLIAKGTVNEASVHMREVFAAAISARAAGIIAVHNHPAGDPTPSDQDITLTNNMVEAANIIGIPVLDHIVIGAGGGFASLAMMGMLVKNARRNPLVSPDEKRINREIEDLNSQKSRIFFEARDRMFPMPPGLTFYHYPPEDIKAVDKAIKPQITEIDNQLRVLRAEKKALKAIKPVKAPKGPPRVEIHLGRCRNCDQKVRWSGDRPGVRMDSYGPKQSWLGIFCPECGGELGRTSDDGIDWSSVIDMDKLKP